MWYAILKTTIFKFKKIGNLIQKFHLNLIPLCILIFKIDFLLLYQLWLGSSEIRNASLTSPGRTQGSQVLEKAYQCSRHWCNQESEANGIESKTCGGNGTATFVWKRSKSTLRFHYCKLTHWKSLSSVHRCNSVTQDFFSFINQLYIF